MENQNALEFLNVQNLQEDRNLRKKALPPLSASNLVAVPRLPLNLAVVPRLPLENLAAVPRLPLDMTIPG